ncbi:MAG: hypothetical protein ACYTEG_00430, partial [Planctomycetota bacterium]
MLRPIVVLLLVLPVSAQELREFFDPAAREFRLPVIERAEFNKLSKKQRQLARGFLRGGYFDPPQYKDSIPQAMNTRRTLFAGFAYRERLMDKQRSWLRAARHASLDDVLDLIELLRLPSPVEFTARYGPLTEGIDAAKRNPRQALLALRHSERQFRAWWVDETGRAVRAANRAGRLRAIRRLSGYLRHRDDAVRMAAARMLGFLDDPEARKTTERGIAHFEEPDLRAALIRARARQGGDDLPGKLAAWVDHVEPELSRAAIAALRDNRASWSLDVLQERIAAAKARR